MRDIIDTFQAARCAGDNWRAHHACGALVTAFGCWLGAGWFYYADHSMDRAIGFLVLGLFAFLYWRYLLPEAKRRSHIKKILYGKDCVNKQDRSENS